jgi:hypothetical protein
MADALTAPVLPVTPPEHILLDYDALRAAGMAEIERLTDAGWTDFNAHDPGITILEALCYALTDLGYRLFHPMPDLLATPPDAPPAPSVLRGPVASLSGRAVTREDLRMVALDVPGVRNAWVEPASPTDIVARHDPASGRISVAAADTDVAEPGTVLVLEGLHRVLIEPAGDTPGGSAALARAVVGHLHANRNLGEDFDEILVLGGFGVRIDLDLEVAEQVSGEAVLLDVVRRIDEYFSPSVPRRGLLAALADTPIDLLVDGPAPSRGFPDRAAFAAATRHREVHRSDLIREIMAVPGVRAVRKISFADEPDAWSLAVPDLAVPQLDRIGSRFRLFSGSKELDSAGLLARSEGVAPPEPPVLRESEREIEPPRGRWRDVGAYRPIQLDLPPAYGVGRGTLPGTAPPERRADSTRLRGYLAFFDQLLASYFAQLEALPALLSPARSGPIHSYAAGRVPDERPSTASPAILARGLDAEALGRLIEPEGAPAALDRRNRLLNHLLARFAEILGNDPLDERLIATKERFLQELPELGAGRGSGVDLLDRPGATGDPPLIRRLILELGLQLSSEERLLLIEHVLLRPQPDDAGQTVPLLTEVQGPDPFSLQVTLLLPARLRTDAAAIERHARAAIPAHLVAYLRWLEPPAMRAAISAYDDWLACRRQHLRRRFDLPEA